MGLGHPETVEQGSLSGSFKMSPLVDSWFWVCCERSRSPQRSGHRFAHSPTDTLIDLEVWCGLRYRIPVRPDLASLPDVRIAVIPKRRPACRGHVRRLGLHPDVVEYLPDVGTVGDEGNDAHLPTAQGAQKRKHLVNAGDEHRPQIVCSALGRFRWGMGIGWDGMAQRNRAILCKYTVFCDD